MRTVRNQVAVQDDVPVVGETSLSRKRKPPVPSQRGSGLLPSARNQSAAARHAERMRKMSFPTKELEKQRQEKDVKAAIARARDKGWQPRHTTNRLNMPSASTSFGGATASNTQSRSNSMSVRAAAAAPAARETSRNSSKQRTASARVASTESRQRVVFQPKARTAKAYVPLDVMPSARAKLNTSIEPR